MTTLAPPSSRSRLPMLPTASALGRAVECQVPWTWGLKWHYEPSAAADFGTAVHAAAEALATGQTAPRPTLPNSDLSRYERCVANLKAWLASQPPSERVAEVAFAYHVATGQSRRIVTAGARDYSDKRPGEIVGTADLVSTPVGLLTVDDYKTGRPEYTDPIATNMQMRFLGLAAARALGASSVRIRLVFVSESGVETDEAVLDELDLCDVAAELSTMAAKLQGRPPANPGSWCRYCPVIHDCPATKATLAKLDAPMSIEIASDEHCAYTLKRIKLAKAALEQIEKAAKDYVRARGEAGIPTGDGKVYGLVKVRRETIDLSAPGAMAIVGRHLGERADELVTAKLSLTKSAVDSALPKADARALYADLRAAGAMHETEHEELKERKAS